MTACWLCDGLGFDPKDMMADNPPVCACCGGTGSGEPRDPGDAAEYRIEDAKAFMDVLGRCKAKLPHMADTIELLEGYTKADARKIK